MDFGNITNNPQADLKAVYIQNTGTPFIGSQEFITDHGSSEVAFHNFKVGDDGIMRATYNISKIQGKGDTILYTQRSELTLGIENNEIADRFIVYPNPTTDQINIVLNGNRINEKFVIKIYNAQGKLIEERKNNSTPIQLNTSGVYFVEISNGKSRLLHKVIRQ